MRCWRPSNPGTDSWPRLAGDVTEAGVPERVCDLAQQRFGPIDVIVYNAYALDAGHQQTFTHESVLQSSEAIGCAVSP